MNGQVITGFWLSNTVTVKLQLAVLLAASVAVQVMVVVPLLNSTPASVVPVPVVAPVNVYDSEVTAQLSVAVALNSVPTTV